MDYDPSALNAAADSCEIEPVVRKQYTLSVRSGSDFPAFPRNYLFRSARSVQPDRHEVFSEAGGEDCLEAQP